MIELSVKEFTDSQIAVLQQNLYVKNISKKAITYTEEFKRIFIAESEKGKSSGVIFREYGFDTAMLGKDRYCGASKRWRNSYKTDGVHGLTDSRKGNSGRPNERELSIQEKYERLKAQNNLLKAENELLKKIDLLERGMREKK